MQEGLPGDLADAREMRGPFVRMLDPVTPLLCYGRSPVEGDPEPTASWLEMLVLGRSGWKGHSPGGAPAIRLPTQDDNFRDPMVIWDPDASRFVMYYAGSAGGIQARTSPDLSTWSEPLTVVGCPPGHGSAEAPFVLQKEGYYYLFVSSEDHASIGVYASLDPLDFGDVDRDLLTELPGHAPEIVRADGVDYMACCSIRRADGGVGSGVYLQELNWVE